MEQDSSTIDDFVRGGIYGEWDILGRARFSRGLGMVKMCVEPWSLRCEVRVRDL